MAVWHAPKAWLGGTELSSDVLIHVADGCIERVSTGTASEADHQLAGLVIPGLVSAHSHAFHRALRGRTHEHGGNFWAWRNPMYNVAAGLTPESYEELAADVFREMVSAGITTVGEFHYVHHRPDGTPYDDPNAMAMALIRAASTAGIRLTILDTLYLVADVAGNPLHENQLRFSDGSVGQWITRVHDLVSQVSGANDDPMVNVGVAAHSVRGVDPESIRRVAAYAEDIGVPMHIHVSEQKAENVDCFAEHGKTPIALLGSLDSLRKNVTLIHATHLTHDDMHLIAESGAAVCLCPTTESDLGDGIGPAHELADAGVPLSLGSDSNAVIDVLHEAWRVEQHDRLRLHRRGIHAPAALLTMATTAGMQSLGWPDGGIATGTPADFIAIDPNGWEMAGTGESLAAIVSSATRASVTDVIIGGVRRKGG